MRCALALPAAMFLLTVPGFQAHAQSAPPAGGQIARDATGGYTLRQTSSLVVLDVVVTDTAGHVVPGLTKSDFTVLQDKQPQTILSFQASGAEMLPVDATVSSTRQLDTVAPMAPVTILLLDEFNTRFEDIAFRTLLAEEVSGPAARPAQHADYADRREHGSLYCSAGLHHR